MTPQKLLTIDALNVIRRVYGANPAPDSVDKAKSAINASRASLDRALREHNPTHVALVTDVAGPNWRHAIYPAYKADRKPMPAELRAELDAFLPALRERGWYVLERPGVEADDVIASLAVEAERAVVEHVILSTDKDIASLGRYKARVYNHFDGCWHDEAWLLEKLGVRAELVLDLLALTGDSSDGIPGVEKVGVKTAAKLLAAHGTLEGVLAAAPSIAGKLGERLREQAEMARLSRRLTALQTDLFTGGLDWPAMARLMATRG